MNEEIQNLKDHINEKFKSHEELEALQAKRKLVKEKFPKE